MSPLVGALADAVAAAFPLEWAEPWDRVGLLVGDRAAEVRGVLVSLDPTPDALARAIAAGANVLLTHHPAFLDPPALVASPGLAGVPLAAATAGIALIAMHTNLDRAPRGADALPLALGLPAGEPLERASQPVAVVVTFAPVEAGPAVREAAAAAGAGRIGGYEGCSFSTEGTGRFTPMAGAEPAFGSVGTLSEAPEERIEVVCTPDASPGVVSAIRGAHPYEEPVIIVTDASLARGAARMGRVIELPYSAPVTLAYFAALVDGRLGVRPTVWGDPERKIARIATAPGSGRSLVDDALAAGADVLVTGELRYHEALDALSRGLAVIEAGHDATEWPMVPVLAEAASAAPGMDGIAVTADAAVAHWWTTEGV